MAKLDSLDTHMKQAAPVPETATVMPSTTANFRSGLATDTLTAQVSQSTSDCIKDVCRQSDTFSGSSAVALTTQHKPVGFLAGTDVAAHWQVGRWLHKLLLHVKALRVRS